MTKTIQLKGEERQIGKAYKKMGYALSVTASQVSSISEDLGITLDDHTTLSSYLYSKAQEMTALNTEVNTHIKQTTIEMASLIESLSYVSITTNDLQIISEDCQKTLVGSLQAILDILEIIRGISASSQVTLDNMTTLTHTSEEIYHLLSRVSEISDQTHLLALNASIESARAGESGRGFAIVAEEIRKLSGNTANVVRDVKSLITAIQHDLDLVGKQISVNHTQIEAGRSQSLSIEQCLEAMSSAFEKVLNFVTAITLRVNESETVTSVVRGHMKKVEEVALQTAESVEDVYTTVDKQQCHIQELSQMGTKLTTYSEDLEGLIATYKLGDLSHIDLEQITPYEALFHEILSYLMQEVEFTNLQQAFHEKILRELVSKYTFIEAIWTNDYKGRFIMSLPTAGIANGQVRNWFKESIRGKIYRSEPYISAITKIPCITFSAPIVESDGTIVGVIGIDVKLKS